MNNFLYNTINIIKLKKITFFVIVLLLLIFLVIIIDIKQNSFDDSLVENKTIDPYILVIKGEAIIKRDTILVVQENNKENIQIGDRIRTIENSSAIIFWPDESITRLGEKTSIKVTTMNVTDDISKIQIKFDISEGKTWSKVIRYLIDNDSYFTETYENKNLAATVRGTVFEVNLEKNYISAVDHVIQLEDTSQKKIINLAGGNAIQIGDVYKFVQEKFLDTSWINWNKEQDTNYIKSLVENYKTQLIAVAGKENYLNKFYNFIGLKNDGEINNTIKDIIIGGKIEKIDVIKDNINTMSGANSEKTNKFLLDFYQKINFLPNTEENIKLKLVVRDAIINTSPQENRDKFIKDFTKLNLFDYLDATNKGLENSRKGLSQKINEYINLAGQTNMMDEVLQYFNKSDLEKIKENFSNLGQKINSTLENLKQENYMQEFQDSIIKDIKDIPENILNIISK